MMMQILFIHVGYLSNAHSSGLINLWENLKTGSEAHRISSVILFWHKDEENDNDMIGDKNHYDDGKDHDDDDNSDDMEVGIISVPTNGGIWCEWSFHSPHPWSSKQSNWDRIQDILKLTACSSTRQLVASYMSQRSRSQILCKSNAFDDWYVTYSRSWPGRL